MADGWDAEISEADGHNFSCCRSSSQLSPEDDSEYGEGDGGSQAHVWVKQHSEDQGGDPYNLCTETSTLVSPPLRAGAVLIRNNINPNLKTKFLQCGTLLDFEPHDRNSELSPSIVFYF